MYMQNLLVKHNQKVIVSGYIRFYIQESTVGGGGTPPPPGGGFRQENKKYIYKKMYKVNRNSGLENICKEISSWCVDSVKLHHFQKVLIILKWR